MTSRGQSGLRRVERRIKAALIGAIARFIRIGAACGPPDWSQRAHRVLYLRYDRLGDMVLATGIIRAIAVAQPKVTVDVLASVRNEHALLGNPYVGLVHTIDKKRPLTFLATLSRIRRVRYDAVIDAMVLAPSLTSLLIMWASGAPHRIGISRRGNDAAFTVPVDPIEGAFHYIDRSAAVLAAFGADLTQARASDGAGWRPELFLTAAERLDGQRHWQRAMQAGRDSGGRRLRLAVNVSAGSSERYWPEERFIQALLETRARVRGLAVLIIGSPHDAERMARVAAGAAAQIAYTPNYRRMMAVVAASDAVLTADTSVTHVASAFEKPSVVMFAGGGGAGYGPYRSGGCSVSSEGPSVEGIDVGTVVEALLRVLQGRPVAEADGPAIHVADS